MTAVPVCRWCGEAVLVANPKRVLAAGTPVGVLCAACAAQADDLQADAHDTILGVPPC